MPNLDRQAPCPSCGAQVTFKFQGARSVVCQYCQAVVARTDRGFEMTGRMAAVLDIPSRLGIGVSGKWSGAMFEVTGRVQMDRADAASAPWQEFLVWFPERDHSCWVANAQGKWYATSEVQPPGPLPPYQGLRPGGGVDLGHYGHFVVAEVSQRRVVAGQGEMPNVPKPGVVTYYADISGPGGQFGTIDYGDGSAPPVLYLGKVFNPAEIQLDNGMMLDEPAGPSTAAMECPTCGASLPIMSKAAERLVCQYCGTASDVTQGALRALGPTPKPPIQPYIPIGARGNFRAADYVVVGFVIRSCIVEGTKYSWREYLLFGGESIGYKWLMEDEGKWSFVEPVEVGDVMDSGNAATFAGRMYSFDQQVVATVDYVIGEFYWKVEIGERVEATDFRSGQNKISRERTTGEVVYSFSSPIAPNELTAFGVQAPAGGFGGGGELAALGALFASDDDDESDVQLGPAGIVVLVILIICVCLMLSIGDCGGGGGGSFGGPSFGK